MAQKEAIRFAYGEALARVGLREEKLIVLDADVSNSTRSIAFAQAFPDRFLNMGIAEANMVCCAAGLSTLGFIPVVNTFSFLLYERALDQLRSSVAYNNLNVKFAAHYAGLSDSFDGASHHSICDLAVIRSIPGMALVNISDAAIMTKALDEIIRYPGPVYFRLCRAETPVFHRPDDPFEIGKANILRAGGDLTIVATGVVLPRALEAAGLLEALGIDAGVIEMHTIKPLDEDAVLKAARQTGAVLTVEEGNLLGGMGCAVAAAMAREGCAIVDYAGIPDCYAQSGPYEALLDRYGLSVETLVKKAVRLIKNKRERGIGQ